VHCAASGLQYPPLVPVWGPDKIRLQTIRAGFPCFNAALAGYVEATRDDDWERNRLCPPNIVPDSLASWARMQVRGTIAARRYGSEPDIAAWANSCALNPARIEPSQRDDPAVKVAAARLADHSERGLTRMAELRTSHCRASRPSDCSESKARRASPNWESAWQLAKAASQLSPPSTTSSIRRSAPPMVVRRGVPEPAGGRRPQRLSDAVSGRDASRRRRSHGCASRRPPSLALRCSDCSEEVEMAKGQPFSVRLEEQTQRLVEAEAQRTRRTRSAVVEAFTEETARTRLLPGIAFRGDDARRRAWVIGSSLDVWEIIHMLEDFGSAEALVADTPLSLAQVRLAVAYRAAYPDEVSAAIAENRRPFADLAGLFPFIDIVDA
jgi:uncharacterized protein (DUF433 family)